MSIIHIGIGGAVLLFVIAYGLHYIGTRSAVIEDKEKDEPVLYTDILDAERPYYENYN